MSLWDVSAPEHKMVLTLMMHKKDTPYAPKQFVFSCMIASTADEEDSVAAASKWASVAPIQITTPDQQKMNVFTFAVRGEQHLPLLPSIPEAQDAVSKGRVWIMLTTNLKAGAILSLTLMPPKDAPAQ